MFTRRLMGYIQKSTKVPTAYMRFTTNGYLTSSHWRGYRLFTDNERKLLMNGITDTTIDEIFGWNITGDNDVSVRTFGEIKNDEFFTISDKNYYGGEEDFLNNFLTTVSDDDLILVLISTEGGMA